MHLNVPTKTEFDGSVLIDGRSGVRDQRPTVSREAPPTMDRCNIVCAKIVSLAGGGEWGGKGGAMGGVMGAI